MKFNPYHAVTSICSTPQSISTYTISNIKFPCQDQNNHVDLYIEVQVSKPYTSLNDEIYISLKHQKLWGCKHIGYDLLWWDFC